jgi:pimeloyl-ACP methyl ester carboxylesterase/cytochrome c553
MRRRACVTAVALLASAALAVNVTGQQRDQEAKAVQGRTVWDGVYTREQAMRGRTEYVRSCAACHAEDLRGNGTAPSLVGESFSFLYGDTPVGELFGRIRTLMPSDRPNSLSSQSYRDIVAFILQSNTLPPGERELDADPDALRQILITTKRSGPALQSAAVPNAQPVDRVVSVNGLRIHYLDWGAADKQPLIMLHGIGRVAHTFDHIAAHFNKNYHVMAVDMRGHGDSDWDPQGAYLVEDYVKDIEGFAAQLQLRNIVIWGNSTGGRVAQVFAGLHPDLVATVISEDVGPERPREIADSLTSRIPQEDEKGWASEDELLAQLRAGNSRTSEEILRAYAHFGSKRRADGRIIWKRDPKIANGFVPTELWRFVRQITSPAIYVLGGRSTIVPAQTQEQLRATLPQVQIVTMPGLGHYPSEENAGDFLAIVDRFLAGVP